MNALRTIAAATALSALCSAQSFTGTFPLNTTNGQPTGLEPDGSGNLLFTDPGAIDLIGSTDLAGNSSILFPIVQSDNPVGIARSSPGVTWIADAAGIEVDQYIGNIFIASFSVAGQTMSPGGMAYRPNTGSLFVVDRNSPQVFEFTLSGLNISTSSLNGSSIRGIAHDPSDDTFWVYDSGTDSLRHYDAAFNELSAVPGTVANGLAPGEGVAVIGSNVYVCATGSNAVAVFDMGPPPIVGEAAQYGMGCPLPNDFYELFVGAGTNDLSGTSFTLTSMPNGYTAAAAGTFDPGFSNNLGSADDSLFQALPLGFTATFPGLGTISAIDVDSNGRIGVGLPTSNFIESVTDFLADTTLAVCWDDLNPAAGGAVYFDTAPGFAMVTWDGVPQFGLPDSNTFQVKLHDDGRIECSYVQVMDDALVGLSEGLGGNDPGSIDISSSLPFSRAGRVIPMVLTGASRPVIGQNFDIATANIPATAIGGGLILGFSEIFLPIPGTPPGCAQLSSGDLATLLLQPTTTIPLPNLPGLVGLVLTAQSVAIDPSQPVIAPFVYSNGLRITIGQI